MRKTPLRPGPGPRRRADVPRGSGLRAASIASSSSLRSGRLPAVNRARKAGNLERAHGPPAFRKWIHEQPCVVCGRVPSDPAHLTNGGMSRKDDVARTVPLCATIVATGYSGHHDEYDGGKRSFRAKYAHLDLPALAAETQQRWLERAA